MNDASLAIDLSKVTKRFGATVALDGASFSVKRCSARTARVSPPRSSCCRD
jgi:ABC-type sugar transport system ATPase subunit